MSTFAITTRTGLISGLRRTLRVVGLRRQRLRVVTRLFLYRDSVGFYEKVVKVKADVAAIL